MLGLQTQTVCENGYRLLFIFVEDTLSTVSLKSGQKLYVNHVSVMNLP